jgi:HD domain
MNTYRQLSRCTCHHCMSLGDLAVGAGSAIPHDTLLPDSPAARAAEGYLSLVSNLTMVRHCKRSYRFGLALAEKAGAKPDLEALYIGCLFHDLGLETRFAGPEDFETLGALEAKRYLVSLGHDRLAEKVAVAIELHTSLETAHDPRPEVAYLSMGAFCDVVGARLDQIEPRVIQAVVAEYPRDGTKALLVALLKHQIETKPQSRMGQAANRADVLKLVLNAPFAG